MSDNKKIHKFLVMGVLAISMILGLAVFAHAVTIENSGKLFITQVDAKIDGKSSKGIGNKETISRDAPPGSRVEFKVEVKNNFTSAEDLDIEDIVVEGNVLKIDDGDDFEEEANEFDLSAEKDKTVTFNFDIPLEVESGTYDAEFLVEGKDQNGTTHKNRYQVSFEVDKETHDIRVDKKMLFPTEISCQRKNAQLTIGTINVGDEDEDDAVLTVTNADLGINLADRYEIDEGAYDDDVKHTSVFTFSIPEETVAGTYPLAIKVNYNDNRKTTTDTFNLVVTDCVRPTTTTVPPTTTTRAPPADEGIVEVIMPGTQTGGSNVPTITLPPVTTTPPPTTTLAATETEATSQSFLKSNGFVALLIGTEVIVALLIIGFIIKLARK